MHLTTLHAHEGVVPDERSLARHIIGHLLPSNPSGGTFDPRTYTFPLFDHEHTYLVSIPGYEHRVFGAPSEARLLGWLARVRGPLSVKQRYLGWWRDRRDWVFDVSIALHGGRSFILDLAESWGQQAVFHPASGQVFYVVPQIKRAA